MNTGPSTQVNNFTTIYANADPDPATLLRDSRGRTPRAVADDQLDWLWRRFVPPIRFGKARELLKKRRAIVLDGELGSGRTSAARMLLRELRGNGTKGDAGTYRELAPEAGEKGPVLDPGWVGHRDRLLLDLSAADAQLWNRAQNDLSAVRKAVADQEARLVVVAPHHLINTLYPDFASLRAEIARPDGKEVFQRYLRCYDISSHETTETPPKLDEYLGRKPPMRDIAHLADLINRARGDGRGPSHFDKWCDEALVAVNDSRKGDVAKLIAEEREGPQRALMLATAMLHGAHVDAVYYVANDLLRIVKQQVDNCPLLERADLAERFKKINVTVDDQAKAHFSDLDYDLAARAHFWTYLPDVRPHLRRLVHDCVARRYLTDEDREQLISRYADQCLRIGPPDELARLAKELAEASSDLPPRVRDLRMSASAKALEYGLLHERYGRLFREHIYKWSCEQGISPGLRRVLIAVCSEVISVRHPDEAMVRLHQLARRQQRATTAQEALLNLLSGDHRLHRRMLDRLARGPEKRHYPADDNLFLELTDPAKLTRREWRPRSLLEEGSVPDWLATGWAAVFRENPHQFWMERVESWLNAAVQDDDHRDLLLDVLVKGCEGRTESFGLLYQAAGDCARRATEQRERYLHLAGSLLEKISTAQGISDFDHPGNDPHLETSS